MSSTRQHIQLYDTTLRDGAQGQNVSLSLQDKLLIARRLDELGIDYLEGGYPLSNAKDVAFFREVAAIKLKHTRPVAFGMTRRRNTRAAADEGMRALLAARTPAVCIVGKSWDLHVREVLQVSEQENLDMIAESVACCQKVNIQSGSKNPCLR
jgi:2-isopropylmalate synthase